MFYLSILLLQNYCNFMLQLIIKKFQLHTNVHYHSDQLHKLQKDYTELFLSKIQLFFNHNNLFKDENYATCSTTIFATCLDGCTPQRITTKR